MLLSLYNAGASVELSARTITTMSALGVKTGIPVFRLHRGSTYQADTFRLASPSVGDISLSSTLRSDACL